MSAVITKPPTAIICSASGSTLAASLALQGWGCTTTTDALTSDLDVMTLIIFLLEDDQGALTPSPRTPRPMAMSMSAAVGRSTG